MRAVAAMLAAIRAQDSDPFEVEAEDELPYVQLGHWIGLADIDAKAKELYWLLALHLNRRRGDRYVWPTTEILALLMGYSRGDKITKFVRELEGIGALTVIKVPDGRGPQHKNVYKLRRTPPVGYSGPRSLSQFYDQLGHAYEEAVLEDIKADDTGRRARQAVSPRVGGDGRAVSPELGGHVAPQRGADVPPQSGAVTRRSLNKKKDNENQAPSARSAGDARRAPTGRRGHATGGRAAAIGAQAPRKRSGIGKGQVRMTQAQARAVRSVEEGYPPELAGSMPTYRPKVVRDVILGLLDAGPEQRTAQQLAHRISRRWHAWGYAQKHRNGEILSYPAVVSELLRINHCGNPRCEDGEDADDGHPCPVCPERHRIRRSGRAGAVPAARRVAEQSGLWECAEPSCRRPGRGEGPPSGLCPQCLEGAAQAQEAVRRRAVEFALEEALQGLVARERRGPLDAADAEHARREELRAGPGVHAEAATDQVERYRDHMPRSRSEPARSSRF
ncbi:hypothetical protein BGK67_32545 [Streptomyces subrutilus]|uniref:Uncharacterized protein n=2 Tax=Streptomyces subrutilus TaxID=36818 RepID=A0A1E5NZQ8_9ACTN|nr:hypothetical protein BGK67_32545 [Streptomyces subrutilus]